MPGTFFGIEIARRGINVHRTALDTTGHNIANANTAGYTRQEAVLQTTTPYATPGINSSVTPGQLGSGVEVTEMRRIRDDYLDYQLRGNISGGGYWQSNYDIAIRVEATYPEPDGRGIKDVMVQFFNDWQNLNNTPRDPGIKAAVVETGNELAALFRQSYEQLDSINKSIKSDNLVTGDGFYPGNDIIATGMLRDQFNQVNNILSQIANLSDSIVQVKKVDQQPNDLLDKRDLLLDQLSGFGPLTTRDVGSSGAIAIDFYGQAVLTVDSATEESTAAKLLPTWDSTSEKVIVKYDDSVGTTAFNLTDMAIDPGNTKGSILGLEAARLNTLSILDNLNSLAHRLADEVNGKEVLQDSLGNVIDFFIIDPTDTARTIKVNSTAVVDPGKVVGEKALEVARLHSAATIDTNGDGITDTTFDSFFESIIAKVGGDTKSAQELVANQRAIRGQIEALRESVSGVSLDEELTKLIQFQYGFQASSRVINTLDDMLDVIINRLF
ncbi:MAG TPA: flagellar hook-associated protein FlgK [Desulfotomaculum sp.]|nr:MAG: hypothetical protein JL56_05100 [Desulfotomaculum sp. BICA1-6]HBX23719.1 flagellar hook-associated protein FlgK [Desulfotomaculum sp.]